MLYSITIICYIIVCDSTLHHITLCINLHYCYYIILDCIILYYAPRTRSPGQQATRRTFLTSRRICSSPQRAPVFTSTQNTKINPQLLFCLFVIIVQILANPYVVQLIRFTKSLVKMDSRNPSLTRRVLCVLKL